MYPGLVTSSWYSNGEARSVRVNVPSDPMGTVVSTADPALSGDAAAAGAADPAGAAVTVGRAAEPAPVRCAVASMLSGTRTVSSAPATSSPTTWPDSVAGSPPRRTVILVASLPGCTSITWAASPVSADGYQIWVNPAPRNRSL